MKGKDHNHEVKGIIARRISRGDSFDSECPSQKLFNHISGRWGTLVLILLKGSPLRFSQIKNAIKGITDRMLIKTLHELEGDALIIKSKKTAENKRMTYSLSAEGYELTSLLETLTDWIQIYTLSNGNEST